MKGSLRPSVAEGCKARLASTAAGLLSFVAAAGLVYRGCATGANVVADADWAEKAHGAASAGATAGAATTAGEATTAGAGVPSEKPSPSANSSSSRPQKAIRNVIAAGQGGLQKVSDYAERLMAAGDDKDLLLYYDCKQGQRDAVKEDLDEGADPNHVNGNADGAGETALFPAVRSGSLEIVKLLLDKPGTDTNVTNAQKETPLYMAVAGGSLPIASALAPKADVNRAFEDPKGQTVLMVAAARGDAPMVAMLLGTKGIQVNLMNADSDTAHRLATSDEVRRLLEAKGGHD